MTTHHCGTYQSSPYCNCYNQTGEDKYHYKQFDIESQTYNCCDQITASLVQLKDIPDTDQDDLPDAITFFDALSTKSYNGCDYTKYTTNPETNTQDIVYFKDNYRELYNNYVSVAAAYNGFIKGQVSPEMDRNNVRCPVNSYPYILSYRSPTQTYYNYAFICSPNNNDAFSSLAVDYGNLDYRITRFHNNSTGQPCIESSCQLITDGDDNNFGDVTNQGNNPPVYNNISKSEKGGLIASAVLSILLFLVGIYIFYKIHKEVKILEDKRSG